MEKSENNTIIIDGDKYKIANGKNPTDLIVINNNEYESNDEIELFDNKYIRILPKKQPSQFNNTDKTKTINNTADKLIIKKNTENITLKKSVRKLKKKNYTLSIIDTLITILIIGPLVVGHWRGIWNLMDFYKFPNGWTCFLTGTCLHWTFAILRENFHRQFVITWRNSNPIGRGGYRGIRLIYTWLFCISCNMQWRGGWDLISLYISNDYRFIGSITLIIIIILIWMRCSRNLLAPPFIVVVDIPNSIFQFPTRYKKAS